jgi:predicted metalloprotease with PDZ domain
LRFLSGQGPGDGTLLDVTYGGPSYEAGLGPGMRIVAVNGLQYSRDELRSAVQASKSSSDSIRLIVSNGAAISTYSIDYHGGPRYPHLERDLTRPDHLGEIIHPRMK